MSLPIAGYYDAGYKIGLFLHILAVVLAFGPTFGYGFFFATLSKHPRAAPAILAGVAKIDRYLVNPGMIVLLLAGVYLMIASDDVWKGDEAFIIVGFLAIIALFGLQHGFFRPQTEKLQEMADRELEKGDTFSPEFEGLSQKVGQVGSIAGLIVVVTIFFMTYKPFL
jgi:Predicted integral membrane protein (DUF2269)